MCVCVSEFVPRFVGDVYFVFAQQIDALRASLTQSHEKKQNRTLFVCCTEGKRCQNWTKAKTMQWDVMSDIGLFSNVYFFLFYFIFFIVKLI